MVAAAVLLLLPLPDHVTAPTFIEGRVRHVVTAPFDGFVARALVRPCDRVTQSQLLATPDERELRLELAKARAEREQASGRLR